MRKARKREKKMITSSIFELSGVIFFAPCFFLNISINCGLGGLFSLKNLEQNGNFYKQNDSQLNCGFSFDKSMFSLSNSMKTNKIKGIYYNYVLFWDELLKFSPILYQCLYISPTFQLSNSFKTQIGKKYDF